MRSSRLSLKEILSIGPLRGAEGDDSEGDGGQDDPEGREIEDADDDEGDDDPEGRNPKRAIKALSAERDRHFQRRQEAEKDLQEAREQLAKYERENKSELENAKADAEKYSKESGTLKERVTKLALQNAFLIVNDIKWHNPRRALQMADLSGVKIDEDGEVDEESLKAAMKKLADEEPYLVDSGKKDDDEEDEKKPPRERTGNPSSGSTKKKQRENEQRERLLRDYPSLRLHV